MITFYPTAQAALIGASVGVAAFLICLFFALRFLRRRIRSHPLVGPLFTRTTRGEWESSGPQVQEQDISPESLKAQVDLWGSVVPGAFGLGRQEAGTPARLEEWRASAEENLFIPIPGVGDMRVYPVAKMQEADRRVIEAGLAAIDATVEAVPRVLCVRDTPLHLPGTKKPARIRELWYVIDAPDVPGWPKDSVAMTDAILNVDGKPALSRYFLWFPRALLSRIPRDAWVDKDNPRFEIETGTMRPTTDA